MLANFGTADGHMDKDRLLAELGELHANTYNWLISRAAPIGTICTNSCRSRKRKGFEFG